MTEVSHDTTPAPDAAQGVASGLSEPRAGLIEDQPRGEGAGAASGAEYPFAVSPRDTFVDGAALFPGDT